MNTEYIGGHVPYNYVGGIDTVTKKLIIRKVSDSKTYEDVERTLCMAYPNIKIFVSDYLTEAEVIAKLKSLL